MPETLLVNGAAGICEVALNKPGKRNAIGPTMMRELQHALIEADNDPSVRAIVIRGEGKSFCAGGDLKEMLAAGVDTAQANYADLLATLVELGTPTIARVHGHAFGGGLGIVAASHLAIASEDTVFGMPEVRRGLFPMMISAVLHRVMPRRPLLEMMLTGESVNAAQAREWGLINRSVAASELDEETKKAQRSLLMGSPNAMRVGLRAFEEHAARPLEEALPALAEALVGLLNSDDAKEGLRAFAEKRAPSWQGGEG